MSVKEYIFCIYYKKIQIPDGALVGRKLREKEKKDEKIMEIGCGAGDERGVYRIERRLRRTHRQQRRIVVFFRRKENSALSTEYVAKALEQFASAKSVKISINAETAVYAGRVNNANSETQVTANDTQTIQGEILLSETETGVDMSLNVTGSTKDNATSETTDVSASVYVLGDNVYVYDEDCGAYIMQSLSSLIENAQPDIFDALSMADLEGMTADIDTAEMIGMLASLLDEYGTVNETSASVSLSYDASLMLNLLIAQINGHR